VAAGRTPNTDRLDVARAGVELDLRGYIRVNDRLQTSAPDVWATGECAGSPHFTHVGEDDCRVILDNLAGGSRSTRGRLIPYCLFTDPELAHVGMHESEAQARGVPYRISRMPMALVLRTRTLSQTRGFMKALIGADDRILGFTDRRRRISRPVRKPSLSPRAEAVCFASGSVNGGPAATVAPAPARSKP
jgi:pyruvate/2-oxoglutarate dehydrogenase complex dihydrolipoamide dehydrogenase (E3) component